MKTIYSLKITMASYIDYLSDIDIYLRPGVPDNY